MRNLKKLSVVLFATLLSFNFTSCIDDGVSDAVDQVYLAQAEFLRAQAALQNAKAQYELARATAEQARAQYLLAQAEVELAYARETDANTARIEAGTADILAAAAHLAALNANALVEAQARLELLLVELAEDLAEAQSDYEVTMLELSQAIADTTNDIIRGLYGTYSQKMFFANQLNNDRVAKLKAIALQKLFLTNNNTISMAFAQAELVAALAGLQADLANAEAEITRLEGLNPSQSQQDITDLEADKAALESDRDDLGVDLAAAENLVATTKAEWMAATGNQQDIEAKQAEIDAVEGAIDGHLLDSLNATKAITKANANITALLTPVPPMAVVDTTTAFDGIATAKANLKAAQDALGADETNTTGPDPEAGDTPIAEENAWDEVYNARLAMLDAYAAWQLADDQLDWVHWHNGVHVNPSVLPGPFDVPRIVYFEAHYTSALLAQAQYNPALTVAQATQDLADADAAEQAAHTAWAADPSGNTTTDGNGNHSTGWYQGVDPALDFDLGQIGIDTDLAPDTYMRVATWIETSPGSTFYIPASFYPTQYNAADLAVEVAALVADGGNGIGANTDVFRWEDIGAPTWAMTMFDMTGAQITFDDHYLTAGEAGQAALNNTAYFVNVEADDNSQSNIQILWDARVATYNAQNALAGAIGGQAAIDQAVADALKDVTASYAALGFTFPETPGIISISDYTAIQDIVDTYEGLYTNASKAYNGNADAVNNTPNAPFGYVAYPSTASNKGAMAAVYAAEKAVAMATAALGTDFRPAADTHSWTDLWDQWVALDPTPDVVQTNYTVYGPGLGEYEILELQTGPTTWTVTRDLPHTGTSVTAYQALRNAYFQRMWAMEDHAAAVAAYNALKNVTYTSPYNFDSGNSVRTNAKTITEANKVLAHIATLLPSHRAALAQLDAEMADLMAVFNTDDLLWDPQDHNFTYNIDGTNVSDLGYIPLLVEYLNAITARNAVTAAMQAIVDEQALIDNTIAHIRLYLQNGTGAMNVAQFEAWRADAIKYQEDLMYGTHTSTMTPVTAFDGIIKDIEQAEVSIALGIHDQEKAQLDLEELERELAVIEAKLNILETTAATILARIEALMN